MLNSGMTNGAAWELGIFEDVHFSRVIDRSLRPGQDLRGVDHSQALRRHVGGNV